MCLTMYIQIEDVSSLFKFKREGRWLQTCFWSAPEEVQTMGCYLKDYQAKVGTWAGRFLWRGGPKRGDANRATGDCLVINSAKFDGYSCFISDWWSGAESWSRCGGDGHHTTCMYWMQQEPEVRNPMLTMWTLVSL